jgi:hypothetical protein
MSGKKRPHGGSLHIKTRRELKEDADRVVTEPMPKPDEGVYTPHPHPDDRFEVQLYSVPHGNFIFESFHRTEQSARKARVSLETFGNRARVVELPRPTPARRPQMAKRPGKTPAVEPATTPADILEMHMELRQLWSLCGRGHLALPLGREKLRQCVAEARAAVAGARDGGTAGIG